MTNRIKLFFNKYPSLRYVISSVSSWVVDNGIYYVLLFPLSTLSGINNVGASTIAQTAARILSSFFNFNMNNYFVFHSKEKYGKALFKYYCLCIPQALISVLIMDICIGGLNLQNNTVKLGLKMIVEAVLFVISYFIQHKWVFRKQ